MLGHCLGARLYLDLKFIRLTRGYVYEHQI
nr:MAG TPA: hypothetical protein [Caudoviricetes sp.]